MNPTSHANGARPAATVQPLRPPHRWLEAAGDRAPVASQAQQRPDAPDPGLGEAWIQGLATAAPKRPQLFEGPEAAQALRVLADADVPPPKVAQVTELAARLAQDPSYEALVRQATGALVGAGAPPSPKQWQAALLQSAPPGATPAAGRRAVTSNTTALVFLVMLQAQRAALEEKRDSFRVLKMYSGMLEDLNGWRARVLIPAQRTLNAKLKEGNLKDSLNKRTKARAQQREERVETTIGMPTEVDTQWGAIDEGTGRVFLPGLRDSETQPTRVDAQELATLIAQTDQWRATMESHQTKQSMDFQRIDSAMNSAWNMLTAFLKSAQEGASGILRNGLG